MTSLPTRRRFDSLAVTAATVRYIPVAIAAVSMYALAQHNPDWLFADAILVITGTTTSAANLALGLALTRRSARLRTPPTRGARISTFLGTAGITAAVLSAAVVIIIMANIPTAGR